MPKQKRERDGTYGFKSFDRICKACGQKLGVHDAEKPWPVGDLTLGQPCDGFKR